MQLKPVTPKYHITKLLRATDVEHLARLGVAKIICNLPDGEVVGSTPSAEIRDAAERYNIAFDYIPITMTAITPQVVSRQTQAVLNTRGMVVAYCATGRRSLTLWALEFSDKLPTDEILRRGKQLGFDLGSLRSKLDLHQSSGATH